MNFFLIFILEPATLEERKQRNCTARIPLMLCKVKFVKNETFENYILLVEKNVNRIFL